MVKGATVYIVIAVISATFWYSIIKAILYMFS